MGECEVCGEGEGSYYILIEGAKLWTCGDCAKRGKIIARPAPPPGEVRRNLKLGGGGAPSRFGGKPAPAVGARPAVSTEVEIVPDYAERIKAAREKMKIGPDVLAELVMEKQSYLERVENGRALPSESLAKRLEKALGIKLFEQVSYQQAPVERKKSGALTLGDLVSVKKKGQKSE